MKKIIALCVLCVIFTAVFSVPALAASNQEEAWYGELWNSIDDDTAKSLEKLGFDEISVQNFLEISPQKVFELIIDIARGGVFAPLRSMAAILIILIALSLVLTFLPENSALAAPVETAGAALAMFYVIRAGGGIVTSCLSALELTRNFMLTLIPVFAGVIAFSGNPTLAVSFNSVVFSFAQGVSLLFSRSMPSIAAIGSGIAAACSLNPLMKLDGAAKIFSKAAVLIMGFIAGIFVAVMSVRGVIAGAADTVSIKGLRFIIGNAVPVVGSAIGEALNSIAAGLGLIKHSMGMLGIIALIIINLPALIELILWRLCMYVIGVAAELLGKSAVKSLAEALGAMFSVIFAAMCFNMFVFVISIAIILTVKAG